MSPSSDIASTSALFKVFIKGEDGRWRIESFHVSRPEAESAANLIMVRDGFVARVML